MNKWLVNLTAGLVLAMTAVSAQAAPVPPDDVVKGTTQELQSLISKNYVQYKADSAGFYKVVDDVVVPHFDLPYIAQLILGRNWKQASDDQRKRFQVAFKNMLIRSYANALLEYHDSVKADWKPLRMAAGSDDVTVNSSLLRENKPPIAIDFAMRLVGDQWKVYDIVVENISLISNFRGQIGGEVKKTSLEDVIVRMEKGQYTASGK